VCVTVRSLTCFTCNGTSPLVRRCCLSCTSAVYSYPYTHTVRSFNQYNLSSTLQIFLHMRCFYTATISDNVRRERETRLVKKDRISATRLSVVFLVPIGVYRDIVTAPHASVNISTVVSGKSFVGGSSETGGRGAARELPKDNFTSKTLYFCIEINAPLSRLRLRYPLHLLFILSIMSPPSTPRYTLHLSRD
jgi:hypothetical protein